LKVKEQAHLSTLLVANGVLLDWMALFQLVAKVLAGWPPAFQLRVAVHPTVQA
jgi:hypothetical protein